MTLSLLWVACTPRSRSDEAKYLEIIREISSYLIFSAIGSLDSTTSGKWLCGLQSHSDRTQRCLVHG